jgi:hypothetical protein
MKKLLLCVVALLFFFNLVLTESVIARGGGGHSSGGHSSGGHSSGGHSSKGYSSEGKYSRGHSTSRSRSGGTHSFKESSKAAPGVKRDSHGRIARNPRAKRDFMKQTGYPHGRPGYVVDHIVPLKKGGCDCPSNMQWQTKEEAKLKDRTE